ncbi:MAG: S9 family peptidase, partial [Gammaproteobacteria bacterium]|nr:S9 family peptidase [Gammaproteobacteria bacterium]
MTARRNLAVAGLLCVAACTAPTTPPRDVHVFGQLVIEGVPPLPAALVTRLEAYQNTRSAVFLGWLGEGILISTRFGNTAQLHRVDEPLGMRNQVTFFEEPVAAAAVSPDPDAEGFLYVKDVGGSEFFQFFWLDLVTGESTL